LKIPLGPAGASNIILDDTELNELAIPSDIHDSESIDRLALLGRFDSSGLELGFSTPEKFIT
jgi:hypothetical protein